MTASQRPRVLHVSHNCSPHLGGLETVVAAETARLAAAGWEVVSLSSTGGAVAGQRLENGVRVVRVRAWGGLEKHFGVPFPLFSPWLVVAAAREVRRACLVHIHDPLYLSSWVAAFWCRIMRKPYVVHRHVGFVHHPSRLVRVVQRVVLDTVGRLVLGGASASVAIDDFVAASTGRRAGTAAPQHVIPNGVDTRLYRPPRPGEAAAVRQRFGLPAAQPLVLFVGRFVPKKGFPLVAAAANDSYGIVFAGGERPADLGDPRLFFLGALPPEQLAEVYRCVDAFVVASVGECPLTVLEAMSSGLPVLANDDPALHSPWTAGPGVTFVDMHQGRLSAALLALFAQPSPSAVGRASRAAVTEQFSWAVHVRKLVKVYEGVLASHRHTRGPGSDQWARQA